MASGYLINRGALALGIHFQNVCKNVLFTQTRGKKRWERAVKHLMARKLKLDGPPPPVPRSQKPNWDYHTEVQAFSCRLHENFSLSLLKTAFVHPSYVPFEQQRRRSAGMDTEAAALVLMDHSELHAHGLGFTRSFLEDWCRGSFPSLPAEGVEAVVGYLTSHAVVCHVAKNLAVDELTMSAEFPVRDDVLHSTFLAVVGALHHSSGPKRAGFFLRDLVLPQLMGKDLFDMWRVVDPMALLVEELTRRNLALPEPRLLRSAGASTVLPLFFVGLYSDKKLLSEGPGETLLCAEEEAARVALRKMYGFTDNRRPMDFSPARQAQPSAARALAGS